MEDNYQCPRTGRFYYPPPNVYPQQQQNVSYCQPTQYYNQQSYDPRNIDMGYNQYNYQSQPSTSYQQIPSHYNYIPQPYYQHQQQQSQQQQQYYNYPQPPPPPHPPPPQPQQTSQYMYTESPLSDYNYSTMSVSNPPPQLPSSSSNIHLSSILETNSGYSSSISTSSSTNSRSQYSKSSYNSKYSSSKYRDTRKDHHYSSSKSDSYHSERKKHYNGRSKLSERESLLANWRKNYCATTEEMNSKLEEYSKLTTEEIIEREKKIWTRTTPAELYYIRTGEEGKITKATTKLLDVCNRFKETLVLRAQKVNAHKPKYEPPQRKERIRLCKHKCEPCNSESSDSDGLSADEEEENIMEELTRKQQHPDRLHPEMWYNDPGEMNDGPLCRCSLKSRKSGIRHGIYAGEKSLKQCEKDSNNADKLYHYRITISPPTNFLTKTPTIINFDQHEYIFEGFSMFSHFPLLKLPTCKVIRFNIEYTILYIEEKHPENFTIHELDLFYDYLFKEVLELVDLDFHAAGDTDGCSQYHFMPRFVRDLPDNGKEILAMKEVLQYLLDSSRPLIDRSELEDMIKMSQSSWQAFADDIKGMVVTYPGKKPCSVRVDQLDRNINQQVASRPKFPEIVHFGIRPPQLSYAGNPEYQKAWRDYVKFRHLLANMCKPTFEDKRKLESKENKLQEMRTQNKMKRDVTVAVSAEGFYRTGIMCDMVQHAMLIPVLVCHLRFHHSLNVLEDSIGYKFKNRALLQLALTHPSYRENFGTNPDHARNSLTNCGIRQPEYGDRRIHYMNTRKRGINTLINIMSRFGKKKETESNITHNERLEFLGDAVVEFLSSIHLFLMFPDLEEGGLATYRAAIVQNQHLAVLARYLNLDLYMLYAHGSDLCHDLELRHAMANCFEALMGALFLDGGIDVADKVFGRTLFFMEPWLIDTWENLPLHPLQEQEPHGDRQWIPNFELLQKLTKFEEDTGIEFKHIRLLARAFTDRSIGYTNLTLGSNQRLEFLGDTVLQLIASEYLYKYFPEHHEGHLSLLRSSLVNNRTQAVVCDDLGMASYAVYNNPKAELKTKDRADLLEAFVGALYIDKGMEHCRTFCKVTLFPRLQDFIMNQDWNDPKSKLQQCCLTLRTMDGGEPDIPLYKVIECKGPTNTRVYTVAVYFRCNRLAEANGHSIQQAEMNAAKKALEISHDLFPQLDHQKRVIAKSMKRQRYYSAYRRSPHSSDSNKSRSRSRSKSRTEDDKRYKSKSHSRRSRSKHRKSRSHSRHSRSRSRHSRSRSYRSISSDSRSRSRHSKSRSRSRSYSRRRSLSPRISISSASSRRSISSSRFSPPISIVSTRRSVSHSRRSVSSYRRSVSPSRRSVSRSRRSVSRSRRSVSRSRRSVSRSRRSVSQSRRSRSRSVRSVSRCTISSSRRSISKCGSSRYSPPITIRSVSVRRSISPRKRSVSPGPSFSYSHHNPGPSRPRSRRSRSSSSCRYVTKYYQRSRSKKSRKSRSKSLISIRSRSIESISSTDSPRPSRSNWRRQKSKSRSNSRESYGKKRSKNNYSRSSYLRKLEDIASGASTSKRKNRRSPSQCDRSLYGRRSRSPS